MTACTRLVAPSYSVCWPGAETFAQTTFARQIGRGESTPGYVDCVWPALLWIGVRGTPAPHLTRPLPLQISARPLNSWPDMRLSKPHSRGCSAGSSCSSCRPCTAAAGCTAGGAAPGQSRRPPRVGGTGTLPGRRAASASGPVSCACGRRRAAARRRSCSRRPAPPACRSPWRPER